MSCNEEDPFSGRTAVKVVSICDLLLAVALLSYYGYRLGIYDSKGFDPIGKGPLTLQAVIWSSVVLILVAVVVFHSLQFVMSLILLSSTYDRDAEDALGKCQLWWCTALTLFSVLGVECFGMMYMMVLSTGIQPDAIAVFMVKFMFRIAAAVNVRTYMKNLKKAPPTSVHEMVYVRSKIKGPPPSNYTKY